MVNSTEYCMAPVGEELLEKDPNNRVSHVSDTDVRSNRSIPFVVERRRSQKQQNMQKQRELLFSQIIRT